ncbi:DUF4153 domain-containing protein [Parvularcula sp. ZS-1/3]|uniref:DUF4153 domain-containing protein n=1 Tax=Parvularcula mediterranea TaxID=2732508 RepID=A0A7Y3RLI9_9PROT|nr:DUF4153 domain-containing protein [Parvularcula mediterranea]NNU15761.1 DUF4153 domain-containing protein [Parvularcula mediterranea]
MQVELDERVPRGGSSLMTVFGLPGAAVGFLFWVVVDRIEGSQTLPPLLVALALGISLAGGTYLLTVLKGQTVRAVVAAIGVGILTAALFYMASHYQGWAMSEGVLPFLANVLIVVVLLPFLRASAKGNSFFDYRPLFADAWSIPAIVGVAQAFVLVGAALAALVAALFAFIGLDFVRDLMGEPWFFMTYAGLLQGVAVGVVRQRESAVLAVRSIMMALLRVASPVFAACLTIFLAAVMIRGFGSLLDGLSPVATLTCAAAVAIVMINAIVADEGRPQTPLFAATSRLFGVLLIFVMALAVYGLAMRIGAEGFTPNRIVALLAVTVIGLYAPIYAAAALSESWVILRQGNIAMSGVLLVVAVFIQTPLFQPHSWSVASQLAIMEEAPGEVSPSDLIYLRDDLGDEGKAAFEELKAGQGELSDMARHIGERPGYRLPTLEDAGDIGSIIAGPHDMEIPETLLEAIRAKVLIGEEAIVTMPAAGEAIIFKYPKERGYMTFLLFRQTEGQWQELDQQGIYFRSDEERDAFLEEARAGRVGFETKSFRVPVVGDKVLTSAADRLKPYEVTEDPAN